MMPEYTPRVDVGRMPPSPEERAEQLASEMLRVGWLHSDIGINDGTPIDIRLAPIVGRFKEVIRDAQREAVEKPKKQLQKCADWLMSAQGYLPPESRGTLAVEFKRMKECEDETRILIKQLEE